MFYFAQLRAGSNGNFSQTRTKTLDFSNSNDFLNLYKNKLNFKILMTKIRHEKSWKKLVLTLRFGQLCYPGFAQCFHLSLLLVQLFPSTIIPITWVDFGLQLQSTRSNLWSVFLWSRDNAIEFRLFTCQIWSSQLVFFLFEQNTLFITHLINKSWIIKFRLNFILYVHF